LDLSSLLDWASSFWQFVVAYAVAILNWSFGFLVSVVGYAVYAIFDGLIWTIYGIVSMIDLSTLALDFSGQLLGLPPALIFLLSQVGFAQALTIVGGAYLVRLLLNLIPAAFTRI
jgi:hypothetical protein